MAGKKDFESFDERKIPETFSFSESENTKQFLSEDFVFKFEDNPKQTGIDSNDFDLGVEDNETKKAADDNFDEIKDAASNSSSSESSEASSSSSSSSTSSSGSSSGSAASSSSGAASSSAAAGASGTIATVAATVTSAVVLVVGGGLAIGQTLERPSICNLSDVVVVENKVSFSLGVGNSQEEIDNDNGSECDIRVELTCPGNADFLQEVKTDHFGKVSGEFIELEYDTEYLLDVRQHVFLSTDSESLLDNPISVRTAKKEVDPTPVIEDSITIYKEEDLLGSAYYSAEVTYGKEMPAYESYALRFTEQSTAQGAYGYGDLSSDPVYSVYDVKAMGKQSLNLYGVQLTGSNYSVALVGYTADGNEVDIFSKTISSSSFVSSLITPTGNTLYMQKVIDLTYGEQSYNAYVYYTGDTSSFEWYRASIFDIDTGEEVNSSSIEVVNQKTPFFIDGDIDDSKTYKITISGFNESQEETEETVLFSQNINFETLPIVTVGEPIQQSVVVYADVDPMGGEYYSIDVSYSGSLEGYESSKVLFYDYGSGELVCEADYDISKMGTQSLNTKGVQLTSTAYSISFVGIDNGGTEYAIFDTYLAPVDFVRSTISLSSNAIFFQQYEERSYYAYINYVGDTSNISSISGRVLDDLGNQIDLVWFRSLNEKTDASFEYFNYDTTKTYTIEVSATTTDQQTITLFSYDVDFSVIPNVTTPTVEPTFNGAKFKIGTTSSGATSVLFVELNYEDESEIWTEDLFSATFINSESPTDTFTSEIVEYTYPQFGGTLYCCPGVPTGRVSELNSGEFEVIFSYDNEEISEQITLTIDDIFTLDGSVDLNFFLESEVAGESDPLTYRLHSFTAFDQYQIYFENVNDSSDNFTEVLTFNNVGTTLIDQEHNRSMFYDDVNEEYKTYIVTSLGVNEDDPNNPVTLFEETINFGSVSDIDPSPTVDASFSFATNGMQTQGMLFVTFDNIYDEFGYLDSEGYTIDIYDNQSVSYYGEIKTDDFGRMYVDLTSDPLPASFFEGGAEYSYDIHNGNYTVASSTLTESDLVSQFTIPGSAAYKWESDAENTYLAYYLESNSFYDDFDYVTLSFSYTPATGGGERSLFDLTVEGYDTYIITTETYDSLSSYTDVTVKAIGYKDGNGTTIYTEIIDFSTLV